MIPLYAIGWTEVLVIAGVVFVLFGAARIPAAFRSLGEGINSFKEGLEGKPDEKAVDNGHSPPAQLEEGDASKASAK